MVFVLLNSQAWHQKKPKREELPYSQHLKGYLTIKGVVQFLVSQKEMQIRSINLQYQCQSDTPQQEAQ